MGGRRACARECRRSRTSRRSYPNAISGTRFLTGIGATDCQLREERRRADREGKVVRSGDNGRRQCPIHGRIHHLHRHTKRGARRGRDADRDRARAYPATVVPTSVARDPMVLRGVIHPGHACHPVHPVHRVHARHHGRVPEDQHPDHHRCGEGFQEAGFLTDHRS